MSLRSLFRLRPFGDAGMHPARDWRALYKDQGRTLVGMFYKMGVHRREELDDLVQETFLEAFRSAGSLQDQAKVVPWLKTIGRRQYIKRYYRSASFELGKEEDVALLEAEAPIELLEDHLDTTSLCQKALQTISEIKDPTKRQALTLFYLGEAPLKEISKELQVKVSTLTTWTSRFRQDFLAQVAPGAESPLNNREPSSSPKSNLSSARVRVTP